MRKDPAAIASDKPSKAGDAEGRSNRWLVPLVCCLLGGGVAIVFSGALDCDFLNFDDNAYIYTNSYVLSGLSWKTLRWAMTNTEVQIWMPVVWISYLCDTSLFGTAPWGYHLTNIVFHSLTVVLCFLVFYRMTGRIWLCALLAALFAFHPLRVESVVWITERKDVLSGFFFMLMLAAYVGYVRRPFSAWRYSLVVVAFALGLMSKPMLVTAPCVLLLLDFWPLKRTPWIVENSALSQDRSQSWATVKRLLVEKIPLFALTLALSAFTYAIQYTTLKHNATYPLGWRIGNVIISYYLYLDKFFCPTDLAIVYPRLGHYMALEGVMGCMAILCLISAGAVYFWRRFPYLLVGWLWYLGMLVPVIGILQVGLTSVADRFTYLPSIGLCIMLVWGLGDLCGKSTVRRGFVGVGACLIVACLMALTWRHIFAWRTPETLWKDALRCTKNNDVAELNLGYYYLLKNRNEEAIPCFRRSIVIAPKAWLAHLNLGKALFKTNRPEEAVACFQKAIELDSTVADSYFALGEAMLTLGKPKEAEENFRNAVEIDPKSSIAEFNLGMVLKEKGDVRGALEHWRKTIALNKEDDDCKDQIAWILATWPDDSVRNGQEAVAIAEKLVASYQGKNPVPMVTLAAAYAEIGDYARARETAERALSLATTNKDEELIAELKDQLKYYQANSPYRDKNSSIQRKD